MSPIQVYKRYKTHIYEKYPTNIKGESKNIVENMQLYDLINMMNKQSKLEILNNYRIDLECRGIFLYSLRMQRTP